MSGDLLGIASSYSSGPGTTNKIVKCVTKYINTSDVIKEIYLTKHSVFYFQALNVRRATLSVTELIQLCSQYKNCKMVGGIFTITIDHAGWNLASSEESFIVEIIALVINLTIKQEALIMHNVGPQSKWLKRNFFNALTQLVQWWLVHVNKRMNHMEMKMIKCKSNSTYANFHMMHTILYNEALTQQ